MSELADFDVELIRADNPGPFSLTGTNTWIVGRDPAWVIDPGPDDPAHLDAVARALSARGGAGGIALTHDHLDHSAGVAGLRERAGSPPLGAARGQADQLLADGATFGPLEVVAVPGHAADHLVFLAGPVCFTGDAVLGTGSVFVADSLGAYLDGLRRLRHRDLALICPGHGPLVRDPAAKLDEYIDHRLDRERRLLAALDDGLRTVDEILDRVWDDAPAALRPAAAVTLAAHLGKLEDEGRLPDGVERPPVPEWLLHSSP
jgi:glyoxylase-like metal-dependent hydrolase (beta-lactamase superfamily II)